MPPHRHPPMNCSGEMVRPRVVSGAELDFAKLELEHGEEKQELDYKIYSLQVDELSRPVQAQDGTRR